MFVILSRELLVSMHEFWGTRHSGSDSPDFLDSEAETTAQEDSQNRAFAVSDARGNFIDTGAAGFQQVYGAFHSHALEVSKRGFPEHILHAARECSFAGPDGFGGAVQ